MKREAPFKPHPTQPGEFLINLAGAFLMAGDAAYGDPAETTPEGQAAARSLIQRFLREATIGGFKQGDTLHALLRRNQPSQRLVNLATDAMNCIPNDLRMRILEEEINVKGVATQERHAPDYPADALRPGPDGVDPRFWAVGQEIQRIKTEHGEHAIHQPQYGRLFAELHRYAPPELQKQMSEKARALGLLPAVTHVDGDGRPVYSLEQVAETLGTTVEELHRLTVKHADELMALGGLHTGPVHPLQ